ncbi:MAG: hypothetical protein CMQ27_02660 [Gammaproteobacteria bacterium]|nr:hypothetical protein [Gammaproteobacteria bacterium]
MIMILISKNDRDRTDIEKTGPQNTESTNSIDNPEKQLRFNNFLVFLIYGSNRNDVLPRVK